MKRIIKFAIIGCGHIGKRHIEMINRNSRAEVVAICDVKPLEELNIENFEGNYYDSISNLLENESEIDVVNIATPNGFHAEHALLSLGANKHVVLEKPMALKRVDAEKVIFKALNVHKQVFAVMQNRYSPPSKWIKKVIDDGIMGDIYLVQLNCYWNRDDRYYKPDSWHGDKKLDGGTLFTQFSHFIDIMYWLFGDITDINARFADFAHQHSTDFEDSGFVNFKFIDGGIGSLNYSTAVADKNLESSLTIIAENGSVKIGGQYMDQVEVCNISGYEMPELAPTNPGNDYGAYKGSAANHNYIIENVVEVLNNEATITTNALEGLKVVDIIERIYNS